MNEELRDPLLWIAAIVVAVGLWAAMVLIIAVVPGADPVIEPEPGDKRIVRLEDLTPPERGIVLALIAADKGAKKRKADADAAADREKEGTNDE